MAERKVPVLRTANSLIEDEFDSLRGRFEEEMRIMELEMERLKGQMMLAQGIESARKTATAKTATAASACTSKQCVTTKTATTSTTKTTSSSRSSGQGHSQSGGSGEPKPQQEGDKALGELVSSPLIVSDNLQQPDGSAGKMLRLRFDLAAYEPEQIVVSTVDNRLQVSAKREERAPNKSLVSEYNRDFLLPAGTNPDAIKSTLSADGVLTVEAPLPHER